MQKCPQRDRYRLGRALRIAALRTTRRPEFPVANRRHQVMPLLQVLMVLVVVGVLLWLVNGFIPMAGSIKSILNAVVVIAVILWLLNAFVCVTSPPRIRIG